MAPEERELMLNPALKRRKVRELHEQGRAAEREYYICSMADADERAAVRRELGVELRTSAPRAAFLISAECLRADHLSCNGYARPTTPNIDALAAGGCTFPRAYATAGDTAQAAPGLLMSALYRGFGASRQVPSGMTTLAEALSAAGFHTLGFNAGQAQASRFYGYARGFDEFCDFIVPQDAGQGSFLDHTYRRLAALTEEETRALAQDCQGHPDIYKVLIEVTGYRGMGLAQQLGRCMRFYPYTAADLVRCALHSLLSDADARDRFFWLHMMDVHESITVPWSPLGSFSPVEQYLLNHCASDLAGCRALGPGAQQYHRLYDCAVAYVDANVGVLANFLTDLGLLDRSLICLTADHAQELFEDGAFGHALDRMAPGLVHVPLVFGGGLAAGLAGSDRPISVLDVAPTILDFCGVADAPESFLGATLRDETPRPVCGQAFYDGPEHLVPDGQRVFQLLPFPAPVEECGKEVHYGIEGAYQVVRDSARGATRLHRLAASPGAAPDADLLARRAEQWLEGAVRPPEPERQVG